MRNSLELGNLKIQFIDILGTYKYFIFTFPYYMDFFFVIISQKISP